MNACDMTEVEVIEFLTETAKDLGEVSPRVVVGAREQKRHSITRTVKFAVIATANNITLIDGLIQKCLEKDDELYFVGSQVNLQGDLEIDYLYFEAKIFAKIN